MMTAVYVERDYGVEEIADPRLAAMWAFYCEGNTLEEIGGLYHVSRERVRQLLDPIKRAHPFTPVGKKARSVARDPLKVLAAARASGVQSLAGFYKRLGITPSSSYKKTAMATLRMIGKEDAIRRLWQWRREAPGRRQMGKMVALYRELGQRLGHTPTMRDLDECFGYPTGIRYCQQFGSMARLATLAGFAPNAAGRLGHQDLTRHGGRITKRVQLRNILEQYANDVRLNLATEPPLEAIYDLFMPRTRRRASKGA